MSLLDHFRLPRSHKPAPPPPIIDEGGPQTRLGRMVARQRGVAPVSGHDARLEALESEYSAPLYDASAYSSPLLDPRED
jgi:hypothetical protein